MDAVRTHLGNGNPGNRIQNISHGEVRSVFDDVVLSHGVDDHNRCKAIIRQCPVDGISMGCGWWIVLYIRCVVLLLGSDSFFSCDLAPVRLGR